MRRALGRSLGIDIHRVRDLSVPRMTRSTLLFEVDEAFNEVLTRAVQLSESGPVGFADGAIRQKQRLWNLIRAVDLTRGAIGAVVECGTYRGLSAHLICTRLRDEDPAFTGKGFHVFDSFQGISAPGARDRAGDPSIPSGKLRAAGMFGASMDVVRATLADFPDVELHPGWIPESLVGAPDGPVRFVHLDVDVHDPMRAALEFFHPRLSPGGALLCDDYGAIRWPGVTAAVDEFARATGARVLGLSTGQAIVLAPTPSPTPSLPYSDP